MGEVEKLLYRGAVRPAPDLYAGKATVEVCESIHLHRRNWRLELTAVEWDEFFAYVVKAQAHQEGRLPYPNRPTEYLAIVDVPAEPGVTPTRFEIEHSKYPTIPGGTIHLHYRDLRLEFTPAEWEKFAEGVALALDRWKESKR